MTTSCRNRTVAAVVALLAAGLTGAVNHCVAQASVDTGYVAQMQGRRRVLLIAADTASDSRLREQQDNLAAWHGGAERDVTVVQIIGEVVTGATDLAKALREQYRVPDAGFTAILIGKDGTVALRSRRPLTGELLTARIDAMPMRRAGQR